MVTATVFFGTRDYKGALVMESYNGDAVIDIAGRKATLPQSMFSPIIEALAAAEEEELVKPIMFGTAKNPGRIRPEYIGDYVAVFEVSENSRWDESEYALLSQDQVRRLRGFLTRYQVEEPGTEG